MPHEIENQISLFRSLVKNRRFDDGTIRVLESILASKDLKSLLEVRSNLREFMRSESLFVMREITEKTVEQKLLVLQFFVRAFALADDVESCMALRYEALVLRDFKSAKCLWLQVSYKEWITFAEQSLHNGFYSISAKACENALSCHRRIRKDDSTENIIGEIKRLKDVAVASAAAHSVQAQAAEYIRKRTSERKKEHSSLEKKTQCVAATTLFRNAIKKRNLRMLHENQHLKKPTNHPSQL